MTVLKVPCGCNVSVDHAKGDRLVRCSGGGMVEPACPSIRRDRLTICPGGRAYNVTASVVAAVRYDVAAIREAAA